MIKLKIPPSPAPDAEQTPASAGGFKLKLSAPSTPVNENPPAKKKRPYQRKEPVDGGSSKRGPGKKRAANDDSISLAAKRVAGNVSAAVPPPNRRVSIKLSNTSNVADDSAAAAAKLNRIPLLKRTASLPKIVDLRARQRAPPRPKGVGYDSEDSDAETDPAIQQVVMLRMQPGEDADFLREAIASGRIGPHPSQGDAEVSLKFVEKNYRRAIVKIRGNSYAAVLVDLPCIVESMKSFDKKGWWKVADIAQMLLVLGRCNNEEEVKNYPLPRDINKNSLQYPHGLTPPMHWVRRRRFRKRRNHTDQRNVEEEVERLLAEDKQWEEGGGKVKIDFQDRHDSDLSQERYENGEDDADGEAVETIENEDAQYSDAQDEDAEFDDGGAAMEAEIQAMFDANDDDNAPISQLISDSPGPIADQAASRSTVEAAMLEDSEATPVGTPAGGAETPLQSSDEDESDEDEDSPDVVDEDAAAKAAERAQQLEEVADLEREVERARQKVQAMNNQLLRQREMQKLAALEADLRVKKGAFGLDAED